MTRELYVYFRADRGQASAVRAAVTDMQARLRSEVPGLQARLLKRMESSGGQDTWMETYAISLAAGAEGVTEALGSTIEQRAAAWRDLLDGQRHIEVFSSCA